MVGYLMRRAATDASFRQGLLATPRATLEREFDMVLPPDFNLRFVENPSGELVIALPEPAATDALSDDDLEAVAGGLQGMVLDVFSTCFSREHLARIQSRLTQTQGDSL